jgi:uroporphyrinogen-III synthase
MSEQSDDSGNREGEDSDIALLSQIASKISATTPLHELMAHVIAFVTALVECDSCIIYVIEGDKLLLRVSKDLHPQVTDRLKMKIGQGVTGWVAEHREPMVIAQGAHDDPRFQAFHELPEDRSEAFLSVPIVCGGRLVGIINVQNRIPHQYTEREISLIAAVGLMLGAEVERVRLEAENVRLSDKLEERKIVERAKGILQRDLKLTEEDAYRTLQRESQERRKSMREIAEAIILSNSLNRRP